MLFEKYIILCIITSIIWFLYNLKNKKFKYKIKWPFWKFFWRNDLMIFEVEMKTFKVEGIGYIVYSTDMDLIAISENEEDAKTSLYNCVKEKADTLSRR